jgi:hypothetical protein
MVNYSVLFHGSLMLGYTILLGSPGRSSLSLQQLGGKVGGPVAAGTVDGAARRRRNGRGRRTQEQLADTGMGAVDAADCEDSGKLTPASIERKLDRQ